MKKHFFFLFVFGVLITACSPDNEFQGRNPKEANVQIENSQVVIKISLLTPYFHLEKVNDDSVPYEEIFFKYDNVEKNYFYKTDLDEWQLVTLVKGSFEIGQVQIIVGEKELTISYPSGTWAFP